MVIEILFSQDTYSDTHERAQDYWAMGVGTVWIIDYKDASKPYVRRAAVD